MYKLNIITNKYKENNTNFNININYEDTKKLLKDYDYIKNVMQIYNIDDKEFKKYHNIIIMHDKYKHDKHIFIKWLYKTNIKIESLYQLVNINYKHNIYKLSEKEQIINSMYNDDLIDNNKAYLILLYRINKIFNINDS